MVQTKVKPENIAAESNTDPRLKGNEETLFVAFDDINRGNYNEYKPVPAVSEEESATPEEKGPEQLPAE